jgi:hypothetical protein
LENGRDVRASQISIDGHVAAGIGAITTRSIQSSVKQRRTRGRHLNQFGVLGRNVRSRFEGQRIRERHVERIGRVRHMWGEERVGARHILHAHVGRDDH